MPYSFSRPADPGGNSVGNAINGLRAASANVRVDSLPGQNHRFRAAVNPLGKLAGQSLNLSARPPAFSLGYRYQESALYLQRSYKVTPV